MSTNNITVANWELIHRLSNYRHVLLKLKTLGFQRVFSENLGDALGLSASQVRKDFAHFEISGNRKAGYPVGATIDHLNEILGKTREQLLIIVGCGKIGRALMGYNRFARERIRVVAGFDSDPALVNPDAHIPIHDMSEMPEFVAAHEIRIAIMTVPEAAASQVLDQLIRSGIRGVLNFAPIQLRGTRSCVVHNVNLEQEVETLFYFAQQRADAPQQAGHEDDEVADEPEQLA
ncbi:MAG: redox-sensing transcriptional repressor Rex [bacterium]